jgi:RimJ/RimL family protein N-acetyltransferase
VEHGRVRLEPLARAHAPALAEAGADPSIFRWYTHPFEAAAFVEAALAAPDQVPFATLCDGRVVGSTRYLALVPAHRRVEIGFTWLAHAWQRTEVNTTAKYLMLRHAFEALGMLRVEFKTDARNARSRAALARIGATEEGTLRSHMLCADGHRRDSVYFSILDTEWPAVRARLEARLSRR